MAQNQNSLVIANEQSMKVSSLTLDKDELHGLCRLLQERADGAAEIEVANYHKGDLSDDQYQFNQNTLREGFRLRISIVGKSGENLWGAIEEVFSSPNYPQDIKSVFIDSGSSLKVAHNYYVRNSFAIFLDFSKPNILDFRIMPSQETPNESHIRVHGYDATWVNGLFAELKTFIDGKSSVLSVVHGHSIYDLMLFFLGFPIAFWVCYRLSPFVMSAFSSYSTFVTSALYTYTFIASLFLFRFLFHYLRWVCPLVEYRAKHSRIVAHRLLYAAISASVIGSFIYDLLKLVKP